MATTPIAISPVSKTQLAPATGTLTAEQITGLVTALAGAGITFSGGLVRNLSVTIKPDGSANYRVDFYQPS